MKLTRLELSGFKSFADTVALSFDDGVTAIVGPNGCGKSNISDAVRWVLGEQRARLLRSARMDEVIFQGSAKRRPINIAEVALIFDNSEDVLPVGFAEVVLTRRLSRSGQSDYLLNQTPVRLRDVLDTLRGTGLGSDAGVVIEAQMIERLLSDRAEERRSLFEEAAGISRYRDRKESTERRLEQTTADLQRLTDLISEVQTQVRSLARQRGKAERHRRYTDERFATVIALARHELAEHEARSNALTTRRDALRQRVPDLRERLTELTHERDARGQARTAAEARRSDVDRQLGDTRLELERLEGDVKLAAERLDRAAERRSRAAEELTQAETRAEQAIRELEAARAERAAAAEARASVQMELDLRSASESEARDRLARQRTAVRELETTLQAHAEQLRALAGERSALEHEMAELERAEADARQRTTDAEREWTAAREDAGSKRERLAESEREEREATAAVERARHEVGAAREHEAALRIERREIDEAIAQLEARRDALTELERKREGLTPAVRALLAAHEEFEPDTVLGPLSDFLRVDADAVPRAERMLGDVLQAVLVRDAAAVAAVQAWHSRVRPGPLLLLPAAAGPARHAEGPLPDGLRTEDARAAAWVRVLVAGDQALARDGTVIRRASGAVYLAGHDARGPLSRRAELEALEEEIAGNASRLAEVVRAGDAALEAHRRAERALESATERLGRARAALRESEGAADDASRRQLRAERERTEAAQQLERVLERVGQCEHRARAIAERIEAGDAERARVGAELANHQSALADLDAAQDAARERRVHWQVEEAQVSAREEAAVAREGRAEQILTLARADIDRLKSELETIAQESGTLSADRGTWRDAVAERRAAVQELEAASRAAGETLGGAEAALHESERGVDAAREELEHVSDELHRAELDLSEADGRRRAVVERLEGEWRRPFAALVAEAPPVEGDPGTLRAEAQRLAEELERIGPVNPLAVEEHAEEVERLGFLESQRDDLVDARASLQQALQEIDQTARSMFLETFDAIRTNFHSVFQTLFEGGECDVRLADEGDPLGSEILIHAAPRGKRTQRIHLLSSGERALVAISLLFSIYLTKPAPFCLLDEVDAPLDDANVSRFVRLLDEFKQDTQFIVITHNPRTMQVADAVYGVTMQEPGVSTIVGVRLGEVEPATV